MVIKLHKMPSDTKGIYKINGVPGRMPERALYLAPDAAVSWFSNNFDQLLTVSDMLRTAESSLDAVKAGRGAQPPGFSAHNFGIAVDVDVKASMRDMLCTSKKEFDEELEKAGFFCHRRDHKMDFESWHYTYLGVGAVISPKVKTIVNYTEAEIVKRYGDQFKLDNFEVQRCLAKLKFYGGAIDGKIGPISKQAIMAFQRAWGFDSSADGDHLLDYGKPDLKTKRTLAFVAAEKEVL